MATQPHPLPSSIRIGVHESGEHTPGPWVAAKGSSSYDIADQDGRLLARLWGDKGNYPLSQFTNTSYLTHDEHVANAHLMAAAPELLTALTELADVFVRDSENSIDRFERLAAMFRKDTGYLAPGKDQPMCGPDQPDGDELRAIYDAWFLAKVTRARAAIDKATSV
jgi:hypothetical protein